MTREHLSEAEALVQSLLAALGRLAADAESQIEDLSSAGGGHVDEFALDYHYALEAAIARPGLIPTAIQALLVDLDEFLDRMSGGDKSYLWNLDALRGAEEWDRVRKQAIAGMAGLSSRHGRGDGRGYEEPGIP